MTEVTQTDGDNWATTDDVRDKIRARNRGELSDYETEIADATQEIQSRWSGITGKPVSDAPTDPPGLLRDATAWLAAEEAAGKPGSQTRNNQDDNTPNYYKRKSEDKIDAWKEVAEEEPGDDDTGTMGSVQGRSSTMGELPQTRDI